MVNHLITPKVSLNKQRKGTSHTAQKQTIFCYLKEHIATASMVSEATGVPQKCICRYKRDLEEANLLWEVEKAACKVTGCKAWYLTTNEYYRRAKHGK